MKNSLLPIDIFAESGCRLPLPNREELSEEAKNIFDTLKNPSGGSLAGLRGPGGIRLHSPDISIGLRAVNMRLRDPDVIDPRVRELAILVTAREHHCQFEWSAHEDEAKKVGVTAEIIEIVRNRLPTKALSEKDAAIIEFGRELFGNKKVTAETYARLASFFNKSEMVDIVNLMGMYAMTAALLIAFDAQLPEGKLARLPRG